MMLDDFRLVTGPGSGLVARFKDIVLAIPELHPSQNSAAERLIELCADASNTSGGHTLPRRLAALLTQEDSSSLPGFGVVSSLTDKLSVMVFGAVEFEASGRDGSVRISGRESATWADRLLSGNFQSLSINSSASTAPANWDILDLKEGVVAASSAVLLRRSGDSKAASTPEPVIHNIPAAPVEPESPPTMIREIGRPPEPEIELEPEPEQEEAVEGDATVIINRPLASRDAAVRVAEPEMQVEVEDATNVGPSPLRSVRDLAEVEALSAKHLVNVQGIYCQDGHFNRPDAEFCRVDGKLIEDVSRNVEQAPRPSLGHLDFDDGSAFELECDYVMGVEPALHQLVREGRALPIVLHDSQNLISRRHAAIRLDGWDVKIVDLGSRNYTFVRIPPGNDPIRLKTDESAILKPGTRVTVGDRSFVYLEESS